MPPLLKRNGLVLVTGLAAAVPVIVSTIRAVAAGWLPLADDGVIAVRAYDVLTTHPPVLGQYSAASQVIGKPVLSPGPMLYWLLALPVRIGELAPMITVGVVNTCAIVGVVALARRRGGRPLMFATAAAVATMCASLDAFVLHDIWNPAVAVLPFTLLIFLAWSLACGEWRLLPLTALVASFTAQAQLTYVLPGVALLAVGLGFLAASRPKIPRRWLGATLAIVIVCWSLPLAEEVVHRPGNVERIVQVATADKPTLGASAGWHSVVRAAGIPPWWLRGPRTPFGRVSDVNFAPPALTTVSGLLVLVALGAVAVAAWRSRRRDLAAAALIALGPLLALGVVTASTPSAGALFGVISYTLWWASPVGMFAWLVLGLAAVRFAGASRRLEAARARAIAGAARLGAPAAAASVLAVAAVGGIVAARGKPERFQHAFGAIQTIVDRVRSEAPGHGTILLQGSTSEVSANVQGALSYALRRSGVPFLGGLPGVGTRYALDRPHDSVLEIVEPPAAPNPASRSIARVVLPDVPTDPPIGERSSPTIVVTLSAGR